ncbi:hypothetical protein BT63DRAFT_474443 [Microthyrium microscopicum]|uniref:Zn(2)-C6 fungal-type domain-containing protein n=1 Tax=Microthyrium microscopicum TaxID=703497 RepID=A0A6A6UTF3_9PEZI|nr:hypothetical protein BT63DRAFT_474443 [Microthyrium microscopicum]
MSRHSSKEQRLLDLPKKQDQGQSQAPSAHISEHNHCDETIPTCTRCERRGTQCRYPEKFSFVKSNESSRSISTKDSHDVTIPVKTGEYTFTTERFTESGALIQKWHRSRISCQPALAQVERQSIELIRCLDQGRIGARMNWFGEWVSLVPQRIGTSDALDQAVKVMALAYQAIIRNDCPSTWIDPRAYARALKSLRRALTDETDCWSCETLTAVTILYYLEAILGNPNEFNAVQHAGGIVRLLEVRGPPPNPSRFETSITAHLRGPVVMKAIQFGVPCFFTSPKWSSILEAEEASAATPPWAQRLIQQFLWWNELIVEVRGYLNGQLSITKIGDLQNRLSATKMILDSINEDIEEELANEEHIKSVINAKADSAFEKAFSPKSYAFSSLSMIHAGFSFAIDRMLFLTNRSNVTPCFPGVDRPWTIQKPQIFARMWQTHQYALKLRPVGASFMHLPLMLAFMHAESDETKALILDAINQINEHRLEQGQRFVAASVAYIAKLYTGEVPPIPAAS